MPPLSIPIMSMRLLDLPLPLKPYAQINFIGAAKDLIRNHQERATLAGVDLELFHNNEIAYSAIQLARYQGTPEWTAYGEQAVEALWFWLALFREENPEALQNSVVIQEHYTPSFLAKPKKYRMTSTILSKGVAQALQETRQTATIHSRLEKYLFGNLQTFFKHIGYTFDKEVDYLRIEVQQVEAHPSPRPIFRENKKRPYDIEFTCNFRLPQTLRLGQSTALGYGDVVHL